MSGTWVSGWATGDVVTAAEFKKGVGCVFDSTLALAAASIDTGAIIPSGYAHLEIWVYARDDTATNGINGLLVRFNNDSGANYDRQSLVGINATASASASVAQTSMNVGVCVGGGSGANLFGETAIKVAHYAGTANNKVCVVQAAAKSGTTTAELFTAHVAGFWRSNAAITRVTVLPASGNFAAGTRMTVYVKGA